MTQEYPITPPPELIAKWASSMCGYYEAARWGADQELEACVELVRDSDGYDAALGLCAERRPKPPSLKEQAFDALDTYIYGNPDHNDKEQTYNTIRRALEQLDD